MSVCFRVNLSLFSQKLKRITHALSPVFWTSAFLILPRLAFADGDTPVGQGLGYLTSAMYGTTGVVIATLAVIVVGLLCLGHVLEWKRLFQTIAGIAIIFGAGAIVDGVKALVSN